MSKSRYVNNFNASSFTVLVMPGQDMAKSNWEIYVHGQYYRQCINELSEDLKKLRTCICLLGHVNNDVHNELLTYRNRVFLIWFLRNNFFLKKPRVFKDISAKFIQESPNKRSDVADTH